MLLPYVLFVFLYVGSSLLIYEFKNLALWCVVLVCHQYDVCENSVGSVYIGGYGDLSGLCVFRKLCPVSFLVVGECLSVLL